MYIVILDIIKNHGQLLLLQFFIFFYQLHWCCFQCLFCLYN